MIINRVKTNPLKVADSARSDRSSVGMHRLFQYTCILILLSLFIDTTHAKSSEDKNQADKSQRPNILLITVDDLNDWLGYTGSHPNTRTPNIDALANRGTAFTQTFSQYPLCGPSRASLFTGLLPSTLGIYHHPLSDEKVEQVAKQHNTVLLHTAFRQNGYKTMAVGKLMHKHVVKDSVDLSGGRGDWDKQPDGSRLSFASDFTHTDWGIYPAPEEKMSDPKAAAWAVERLQEKHDKPFMLMVGLLRPHAPWYVPQPYFDAIGDAKNVMLPPYQANDLDDISTYAQQTNILPYMPKTPWLQENQFWHDMIQGYLASINFADHYVGQVLKALENSPYADNTIVLLTSDHGYHLGEKGTTQKHTLWERANKVPLIIAGPSLPKGEQRDQTVGLIDIYPTLLDLAQLPKNPINEGHSLLPVIKDNEIKWPYPTFTQYVRKLSNNEKRTGQAIQFQQWRYILYGDGSEELYNHKEDPNEWTNLAGNPETRTKYASLIEKLKVQLPKSFKFSK